LTEDRPLWRAAITFLLSGLAIPITASMNLPGCTKATQKLPDILELQVNGIKHYMIHNVNELEIDLNAAGIRAVISGHSHKPSIVQRGDVLFLNPGWDRPSDG
jgi:predicted phosphodiesterase